MDVSQPPPDPELKTIIDKLAQFVARNGTDFEQMTKQKQKDNPKFSFLFGGEYYNYYQYKVSSEQAILRQRQQHVDQGHSHMAPPMLGINGNLRTIPPGQYPPSHMGPHTQNYPPPPQWTSMYPPGNIGPPPHHPTSGNLPNQQTLEKLLIQQKQLQDQIQQSEQNLAAQHQVLMEQQHEDIEEAIRCAEEQRLNQLAHEAGIDFLEVDQLLQPIVESCTKDSVSHGKAWIVSHGHMLAHQEFVCRYLLKRATDQDATFSCKLHLIYLINDVLHHWKGSDDLRRALENAVVPMFCNATISATPEQKMKLDKLLNLWESKHNYFSGLILAKLKNPSEVWADYQASLITDNAHVITPITTNVQQLYERYQQQHQAFVAHATQQLQQLQQQQQQLDQQSAASVSLQMSGRPDATFCHPPPSFNLPPPGYPPPNLPPESSVVLPQLPDLTKPPPGYEPNEFKENLTPNVPYYELPAGLVAPLVKLEDSSYRPLNPDDIRLPPPTPPSERLLAAVEMFYSPPSHDHPIDSEGWEKLGLYEYFKAKNAARKKKEQDILEGLRSRSRSPSPVMGERSPESPLRKHKSSEQLVISPFNPLPRSPSKSPSPPSFVNHVYSGECANRKIDESNKGHQLLKKMGWTGMGGLGLKEQGIEDPISGGEVRDHVDQYRGIGLDLSDPFENFRKNKGMAFINRMRSRAEEKP